jgi:hypothetical protein
VLARTEVLLGLKCTVRAWAREGEPGAFPAELLEGVHFQHSLRRPVRQLTHGREGDGRYETTVEAPYFYPFCGITKMISTWH